MPRRDGSVWYLGEDVFNYEGGVVADTEGTWLAGRDGPAALIMPADPKPGNVWRPENIPGVVFEEVTVDKVGQTLDGPRGPVAGALVTTQLYLDGHRDGKTFAPGYGEFSTGAPGPDLEAVSLVVPTDARPGPPPAELETAATATVTAFEAAGAGRWTEVTAAHAQLTAAWNAYRGSDVPRNIAELTNSAAAALGNAAATRNGLQAQQASVDVAQSVLDLRSRHVPVPAIDLARLDVVARQLLVDTSNEPGAFVGDVVALEQIWARTRHTVAAPPGAGIDAALGKLRAAADAKDVTTARAAVPALREAVRAASG